MKKRFSAALLALVMLCAMLPVGVFAEEATLTVQGVKDISKYGNVKLETTVENMLSVFAYGDIVTVSFGSHSVDVPVVTAFSCVDAGQPGLFLRDGKVELSKNSGNFAADYGIAHQTDPKTDPTLWAYEEGFSKDMEFTFTMKEKAGYLEEFTIRDMSYTNNREDFPDLTDEQFCNFRMVTCGHIQEGVLYRSASPLDPKFSRNTYSEAAVRNAGVTVFIDLADTEETLGNFENYADSYFAQQEHIAIGSNVELTAPDNLKKFVSALSYMADHPGVYDVFCVEGKDRTGIVMAILECLMGATIDEVGEDYMLSFYNYYGVTPDAPAYEVVLNSIMIKNLNTIFDTDVTSADLHAEAEEFLLAYGMTQEQIVKLEQNLSGGTYPAEQPAEETEETVPETEETTVQTEAAEAAAITVVETEKSYTVYYVIGAVVLIAAAAAVVLVKRKK